ncbi:MAG TPA: glutaredoxin family protein [Woeseiaceae bacterium]|nr:glutaredoxin family protein [Woeseiaceae bacterium]
MLMIHYYTRHGCHLCDVMLEELMPLVRDRAEICIRDVDTNPEWLAKYDRRVPVIEVAGRTVSEYPLDHEAVRRCLAEKPEKNGEIGILRG